MADASGNPETGKFTIPEVIFIGLLSATNVALDLLIGSLLKLFLVHVIAGVIVMVPFNFIFMSLARHVVDKFGTLTMYLIVFGVLAIPFPLFGSIPGPYKIVVGAFIGVLVDLAFTPRQPVARLICGSIGGAVAWWVATFTTWQAFGLPFVPAFATAMNALVNVTALVSLPITGFSLDFFMFSVLCGLLSAGPTIPGAIAGRALHARVARSSIYTRFKEVR